MCEVHALFVYQLKTLSVFLLEICREFETTVIKFLFVELSFTILD